MQTGLETISDQAVIDALWEAARQEGKSLARVLRCLMEFSRRRLLDRTAYPSLFDYCTRHLGYSEAAAYKRIRAAKAATEYPEILDLLQGRRTDLTRIVAICAHLTKENHEQLLSKACSMHRRDLEFFVAGLAPKPAPRDVVRSLPVVPAPEHALPSGALGNGPSHPASPSMPAVASSVPAVQGLPPPTLVAPLSESLARIAFTADRETVADLDRACGLLHIKRAEAGQVIARALKLLLRQIDPDIALFASEAQTRKRYPSASRRVPKWVRMVVRERDHGRCTFVDAKGARCCGTVGIEYDHVVPWSLGGRSDDPNNIRLLCALHNHAEARHAFGDDRIDRAIALKRASGEPEGTA